MGEALYGDPVYEYNGHHYQIVGGNWAQITWRQAEMDAWGRCFGGVPGYLATVDDAAENAFYWEDARPPGLRVGNAGWIGANDMTNEGTFEWLDGFKGGTVFYRDGQPVAGLTRTSRRASRTRTARRTASRCTRRASGTTTPATSGASSSSSSTTRDRSSLPCILMMIGAPPRAGRADGRERGAIGPKIAGYLWM